MNFVRYLIVQIIAYALDLGGFLCMFIILGSGPILANIFGKIIAGVFAFFAHRIFTFEVDASEGPGRQALLYFILLALNVPISSAMLSLILHITTSTVAAKIISDCACVLLTYWLSRTFVFSSNGTKSEIHRR